MTYTHQLVVNLLLFRFQLQLVGERLPFTASTHSEMLAKRLQTMLRGLFYSSDEAFHIALALFRHPDVHHVAGNGEGHEYHEALRTVGNSLALGRHGLDNYVFQDQIQFSVSHWTQR